MEAADIHLRTRTYLGLLLLASAIAVVIALATLAFLGAYSGLKDVLWEVARARSASIRTRGMRWR